MSALETDRQEIGGKLLIPIEDDETKDAVFEAREKLLDAGVSFDTGIDVGLGNNDVPVAEWMLDWSLEGATLVEANLDVMPDGGQDYQAPERGLFTWTDEDDHQAHGVGLPDGTVVVQWDRRTWPPEERVDQRPVTIYGGIGDFLTASGGEIEWNTWQDVVLGDLEGEEEGI